MINTYSFKTLLIISFLTCLFIKLFGVTEFDIQGRIESIRKTNSITILFVSKPADTTYYIINGKGVCGSVEIDSVVYNRNGVYKYRAAAHYTLTNKIYKKTIRAGADIALVKIHQSQIQDISQAEMGNGVQFRTRIVAVKDGREMVLVKEGKFIFGSDTGDRDETPEQTVYLDNYYIDVYEVTNAEFGKFVTATNSAPPRSWEGGMFREGEENIPVLVTYYEAAAYARWSGKRLPTEEEWEKAARGPGRLPGLLPGTTEGNTISYPWGNNFDPQRSNSADFWIDDKTGAHIKMRFNIIQKGLMPVKAFDPDGASPYGAVNMAGNVKEWTASWYTPYKGNTSKLGKEYKKYGKQFKVVRGGAWYSHRYRVRVTSREIGGIPNLHVDNLAGFRCVRDASALDHERN